jgi:hypothetical protein
MKRSGRSLVQEIRELLRQRERGALALAEHVF